MSEPNVGGFTVAQFVEGARRFAEAMRRWGLSVSDFGPREDDIEEDR